MIEKSDGTFRLSVREILSKAEDEVDQSNPERVYKRYLAYKHFAQQVLQLELERRLPKAN
jgi:hypothetical protein